MNKILLITNPIEQSKTLICWQLQHAWNRTIESDKRKDKKLRTFLTENDEFIIIDNKEKYTSFDKSFIPNVVFVVPELMWGNEGINEGYDIARELISQVYKSEYFQLVFLSVLEKPTLRNNVAVRNRGFVEAFPHVCLLDDEVQIKFEYYSEIHFNLIKYIAISEHGRLQKIGHEMNSVKSNIQKNPDAFDINKTGILKELFELGLFQAWTTRDIQGVIEEVNHTSEEDRLEAIVHTIEEIIDEISIKLPGKNDDIDSSLKNKSNYRVFIIEDEQNYQDFFYKTFSKFYKEVYPDLFGKYPVDKSIHVFSINEAFEIVKKQAKNYQIFLLDLLYKDKNGNWLNFNGLDLFKLIRKVNPYATIRIITSLPRGIVAKVVEVILANSEKPNTDQVFTKKYGYEALHDNIVESIDNINAECKKNEKSKTTWAPFPKKGFFEASGIPELLQHMLFVDKVEFKQFSENSQKLFNEYLQGNLNLDTADWNGGSLPKPAMKRDCTEAYFKGKLINIMTHRLIALQEASADDELKIYYDDYELVLKKICNLTSADKGYFQTKLGFNGSEYKTKANGGTYCFKINPINLFPHESSFLHNIKVQKRESNSNQILEEKLNNTFKYILSDASIFDIWDDLNLEFSPYDNQKEYLLAGNLVNIDKLPDNLTYKNLWAFINSLINNYSNDLVPPIISIINDYILENNPTFETEFDDFTVDLLGKLINKELSD